MTFIAHLLYAKLCVISGLKIGKAEYLQKLTGHPGRVLQSSHTVGKRVRCERIVTSKSPGWLPSVGAWLHSGNNSGVSPSKEKAGLFRKEAHSMERVQATLEGKRGTRSAGVGLSVFIG